jgi:hypothetical protein
VETLEERAGAHDHDADAVQRPQPPLLPVQAGDEPVAACQLAADRTQRHHVAHTALADRRSDRLAARVLVGVVVGQARVQRGQRVDRVGAGEGACQVIGVADIAGDGLGSERVELGELLGRATERTHLLAGFEQQLGDLAAGVSGGSHHGDHGRPLKLAFIAVHPA